jgi:hypothetical protein
MVVHGFGNEGDARHVTEGRHKILACEFLVQLAMDDFPAGQFGEESLYFGVGQFLCGHDVVLQKRGQRAGPLCAPQHSSARLCTRPVD